MRINIADVFEVFPPENCVMMAIDRGRWNRAQPLHALICNTVLGWVSLGLIVWCGCSPAPLEYRSNALQAASLMRESSDDSPLEVADSAAMIVETWFGTPDSPRWPSDLFSTPDLAQVVDMDEVARCAGAVGRADDQIERGLFRKHCVACHGITGDGRGAAAALLAPYPRDFRRGTFKFKSTPAGFKPTREDLQQTLFHGIPGTAMPAFATLSNSQEFSEDIDALVEYVRFLAIRGEIERRLIAKSIREGLELATDNPLAQEVATDVVERWKISEHEAASVPEPPSLSDQDLIASIERGREWYASELTACVKCHGATGHGDGASQDYDEWTKDWTIMAGIDPKSKTEWKEMKTYGALKPVIDHPRNFSWASFRGGKSPQDIFKRLVLGIEGTPMPPIARAEGGNQGLTDAQIWDVVHYVMSLGDRS